MSREQAFERGNSRRNGKGRGTAGVEAGHACKVRSEKRRERKLVKWLIKFAKEVTCFEIGRMREDFE
jgi:hypothetical protein